MHTDEERFSMLTRVLTGDSVFGAYLHLCPFRKTKSRFVKATTKQGTWVAQSVSCPTLDFGPGHDLMAVRSNLTLGSAAKRGACSGFSPLSLCPSPCLCVLSLNKL